MTAYEPASGVGFGFLQLLGNIYHDSASRDLVTEGCEHCRRKKKKKKA